MFVCIGRAPQLLFINGMMGKACLFAVEVISTLVCYVVGSFTKMLIWRF